MENVRTSSSEKTNEKVEAKTPQSEALANAKLYAESLRQIEITIRTMQALGLI